MTLENKPSQKPAFHLRERDSGLHMGWFYALSVFLSRVVAIACFEIRVLGSERVPRHGALILAANHQSVLDPWLVGLTQLRRAAYLARESLFRLPVLGWLLRRYDSVPVVRETTAARQSLDICIKVLQRRRALVLFPEGTRSLDGRLQALKRGISLIVRKSGAPVQPLLIQGAFRLWPRTQRLPWFGQVKIFFGNAIEPDREESSDALMERLEKAYRELALAVGAVEILPRASLAEGEAQGASPSISTEKSPVFSEAASSAESVPLSHRYRNRGLHPEKAL